ncbi:MAG: DUF502 domain-containing protein [Thermodesulfobacteriota bacterium]
MNKNVSFLKTTLIGGLIFLIPVVVIAAVFGKAIKIMIVFAKPLEKLVPFESIGGIAVINILAFLIMILLCFLAGLFSRSSTGKRAFNWFDSKLLELLPQYAFVKGFAGTLKEDDEEKVLIPVFAKLDDQALIGFEVERIDNGLVAVYLPGSPDTLSGTVAYMTEDRVEPLNIDFKEASKILRTLGRGSKQLINAQN